VEISAALWAHEAWEGLIYLFIYPQAASGCTSVTEAIVRVIVPENGHRISGRFSKARALIGQSTMSFLINRRKWRLILCDMWQLFCLQNALFYAILSSWIRVMLIADQRFFIVLSFLLCWIFSRLILSIFPIAFFRCNITRGSEWYLTPEWGIIIELFDRLEIIGYRHCFLADCHAGMENHYKKPSCR